ncbi:MAG TPA: hypothetical protein VG759_29435 [Candidatus Angelobacter sp.]|nr:hypothetical protein [Candidatus Angelobacter sp.]
MSLITVSGDRLASSWISRPLSRQERTLPDWLQKLRYRGWRGGIITPHRAFARLRIGLKEIFVCACLVYALSFGWIKALPFVGNFWGRIFAYWAKALNLEGSLAVAPQHWGSSIHFSLPFVNMSAGPADAHTWWIAAVVTLLAFAASYFIPEEHTPWMYLLRFLVLIQGTALVYFVFAAARFPHDLPSYTISMLFFGAILTGMIPLILGFTYFLFDFSLFKKVMLSLISMGYLTVFLPFQYMLQIYILRKSILYMPLLYFAFGPFLDVLIFVSLYSWGMSWKSKNKLVY